MGEKGTKPNINRDDQTRLNPRLTNEKYLKSRRYWKEFAEGRLTADELQRNLAELEQGDESEIGDLYGD